MKRKYNNIVFVTLIALSALVSCTNDDSIDIGAFEYNPTVADTSSLINKKIAEIEQKYQSKIIYNWDSHFIGNSAIAVPPYAERVSDYLLFLEEIWFKPYKNNKFLLDNLPREIVLVGGKINYGEANGSNFSAAGLADSQYRIVIGQVNDYSINFNDRNYKEYRYMMEKVLHHEFAHILCKRHGIPEAYTKISAGLYMKNTHYSSLSTEEAIKRGFVRSYGASNELEDFATLVEVIITRSKNTLFNRMFLVYNEATGGFDEKGIEEFDKLYQKYKIIIDFYNKLGVDIQEMGNESELLRYS